jgi:hypothetical protein
MVLTLMSDRMQQARELLAKARKNLLTRKYIGEQVLSVLKELKGREITKAIATRIKQLIPDAVTHYEKKNEPYMTRPYYQLKVWGAGLDYNQMITIDGHDWDDLIGHAQRLADTSVETLDTTESNLAVLEVYDANLKRFMEAFKADLNQNAPALHYIQQFYPDLYKAS